MFGTIFVSLATVATFVLFVLTMASTPLHEKDAHLNPYAPSTPVTPSYFNPVSPFFNAYDRFASWRRDLGLPQPGTVENLQKEVKGTQTSSFLQYCPHCICSYSPLELHL